MSILNQDVTFESLSMDVRSAFTSLRGEKVLLPVGTSLFRFSGHAHTSPWWSETRDLPNLLLSAKGSGQSLFHYVRNTTAVLRRWDMDMFNLIVAQLNKSVYAFKGSIAPQNEAIRYMNPKDLDNYKKRFTKPVFFGGGNGQVYINGISGKDLNVIVPAGAVNVYDDIDDIIDMLTTYKII